MLDSCEVSVPGKLMLLGEHAVLRGQPALVCAIDRRLRVRLTRLEERVVRVASALGSAESPLERMRFPTTLRFVEAALSRTADLLNNGVRIEIRSDLPPDVGFGSSAAVTVGVIAGVLKLTGSRCDRDRILSLSVAAVRDVQGRASGADVAASVYGGIVEFRSDPLEVRPIDLSFPLTAVYSGRKERTRSVIERVDALADRLPDVMGAVFEAMGASAMRGAAAVRAGELGELGRLLDLNHGLMAALGVTTPEIDRIAWTLRTCRGILGAKVSGAGLGDCVVGLGRLEGEYPVSERLFSLSVDREGLRFDEA